MSNFNERPICRQHSLVAFRIINWGCLLDEHVHVNGSILFTGQNKSGKSTALDALSYLLCGNQSFNQSSGGKGRSVLAYVRGNTESDEDKYLRSGEIVSYIAAEFYDPVHDKHYVKCVCIESPDELTHSSHWLGKDDARLEDFNFIEYHDGVKTVTPAKLLTCKGQKVGKEMLEPNKGVEQFIRMGGLRCNVRDYRRKMQKCLSVDTTLDINSFIRQNVLDEHPVNSIKTMHEQKKKIDELQNQIARLKSELGCLDRIIEAAEDYEKKNEAVLLYEMMLVYQDAEAKRAKKRDLEHEIKNLTAQIGTLDENVQSTEFEMQNAQRTMIEAEKAAMASDLGPLIKEKRAALNKVNSDIDAADLAIQKIGQLHSLLTGDLKWIIDDLGDGSLMPRIDLMLAKDENMSDVIIPAFDRLSIFAENKLAKIKKEIEDRNYDVRNFGTKIESLTNELRRLKKGKGGSIPEEIENAVHTLKEELAKRGIRANVRTLSDLVTDFTDEKWRRAIEAYLGRDRYAVFVDPEYCMEAVNIWHDKHLPIEVKFTDRIPERSPAPGSAASVLKVPNDVARNYISFRLNGLHLCKSLDEMHDHPEGGLMSDGTLAKNFGITRVHHFNTVKFCLGTNSVNLEIARVKAELTETQKAQSRAENEMNQLVKQAQQLASISWSVSDYGFDMPYKRTMLGIQKKELESDIESLQNNPDLMAVEKARAVAQEDYRIASVKHTEAISKVTTVRNRIAAINADLEQTGHDIQEAEAAVEEKKGNNPELVERMETAYKERVEKTEKIAPFSITVLDRRKTDLIKAQQDLTIAQSDYFHMIGTEDLGYGPEHIKTFRQMRTDLQNVRIEEAQSSLAKNKKDLHTQVVKEFFFEMNDVIHGAKNTIKALNRELRKLPFNGDRYYFEMTERPDRADFFAQCNDLESLASDIQIDGNTRVETFIEQMISDISASDGDSKEYTDYRRYFNYTIKYQSSDGRTYDLNKKQSTASGGERDVPYMLIVIASLLQCYSPDTCCERIVMIDEAFSKLSNDRIVPMVHYLEDNGFQAMFAAPTQKIESIGEIVSTSVALIPYEGMPGYSHIADYHDVRRWLQRQQS